MNAFKVFLALSLKTVSATMDIRACLMQSNQIHKPIGLSMNGFHSAPGTLSLLLAASLFISTAERKRVFLQTCCLFHLSVCQSVRRVNCGKTA